MVQVGGKHKQRAIAHANHDLIGVLRCEFNDRRPDDAGLLRGTVKTEGVGTFVRAKERWRQLTSMALRARSALAAK